MDGIAPACIAYQPAHMRLLPAHARATIKLMRQGIPFAFARYAVTDTFIGLRNKDLKGLQRLPIPEQARKVAVLAEQALGINHRLLSHHYKEASDYLARLLKYQRKGSNHILLDPARTCLYGIEKPIIRAPKGYVARCLAERCAFGFFSQQVKKRTPISIIISDYAVHVHRLPHHISERCLHEVALWLALDGHFDDPAMQMAYVASLNTLGERLREKQYKKTPLPILSAVAMLCKHESTEAVRIAQLLHDNFLRAKSYLKGQRINAETAYDMALDVFGVDAWPLQREILNIKLGKRPFPIHALPKRGKRGRSEKKADPSTKLLAGAKACFDQNFVFPQTFVSMTHLVPAVFNVIPFKGA